MKPHFAELSPLQALQAAIAIERRNAEIYQNLAGLFQSYDGKLGEVFACMADEETAHRLELEAFLAQKFPGQRPTGDSDAGIHEAVEAPDLEEPEVFIFDNVSVKEAIEMAERAEDRACTFYQQIAKQASDAGLRDLCRHMAEVEAEHKETFARWKTFGVEALPKRTPAKGTL